MDFDYISRLENFLTKNSIAKHKFFYGILKRLSGLALAFAVYFFIVYQQPDRVLDNYFGKIKLGGGYMEESWDILTERCQKRVFKTQSKFRESQSNMEVIEIEKLGKFKLSDLFPSERNFRVTVVKAKEEHQLTFSMSKVEGRWKIIQIDTFSTLNIRK